MMKRPTSPTGEVGRFVASTVSSVRKVSSNGRYSQWVRIVRFMTTPMTEFQASVASLGETTVDYIGKERLQSVRVIGDELGGSADIEVCLKEWTWEDREHALGRLIEVRDMFFDELAISYAFVGPDEIVEPVQRSALAVIAFSRGSPCGPAPAHDRGQRRDHHGPAARDGQGLRLHDHRVAARRWRDPREAVGSEEHGPADLLRPPLTAHPTSAHPPQHEKEKHDMNADEIASLPAGTRVRVTLDGQVVAQGRGRAGSPGPTIKLEHGPIDSSHYMARESRPSGALMHFEEILSYARSVEIRPDLDAQWRDGDVVSVESAEAEDWSVMARRRGTWMSLVTGDLGEHCADDLITHRARRGEVELLVRSGQPLEQGTAAAAAAAVAGR